MCKLQRECGRLNYRKAFRDTDKREDKRAKTMRRTSCLYYTYEYIVFMFYYGNQSFRTVRGLWRRLLASYEREFLNHVGT